MWKGIKGFLKNNFKKSKKGNLWKYQNLVYAMQHMVLSLLLICNAIFIRWCLKLYNSKKSIQNYKLFNPSKVKNYDLVRTEKKHQSRLIRCNTSVSVVARTRVYSITPPLTDICQFASELHILCKWVLIAHQIKACTWIDGWEIGFRLFLFRECTKVHKVLNLS